MFFLTTYSTRQCKWLQVEFFGPLCDLVEGSLEVDVGGVEVADRVDVPSLAELCVRSIHRARLRRTYLRTYVHRQSLRCTIFQSQSVKLSIQIGTVKIQNLEIHNW